MLGHSALSQLALSEQAAATGGTAYTLALDSGAFTLTGTAATLRVARRLALDSGTFALTGTAAGLKVGRKLALAAGAFTLTGTAATLRATRSLACASGSFALTGTDAGLRVGRKLALDSGTFALTGSAATLSVTRAGSSLVLDSGAFVLAGADATLSVVRANVQQASGGNLRWLGSREDWNRRQREEDARRAALDAQTVKPKPKRKSATLADLADFKAELERQQAEQQAALTREAAELRQAEILAQQLRDDDEALSLLLLAA